MTQIQKPFYVAGISLVTSNQEAFEKNSIVKLWEEFSKNPPKLQALISDSVYAVYSNYESDYSGKYRITIGFAVKDLGNIPNSLRVVTISAGKYKVFEAKSSAPEDVVSTWQNIWQTDPAVFKPNFSVMFEEYKPNNEVTIFVGCN